MRRVRPLLSALVVAGFTSCTFVHDGLSGRVVVDVGHSPRVPGAIGADGVAEYTFNRRFADAVAERLAAAGEVPVTVVRINGDDPLLDRRVSAIAAAKPALILSIHHDSVQERFLRTRRVGGVEQRYTDHAAGFSLFVPADTPVAAESLAAARAIADALTAVGRHPSLHHAEPVEGESRRLLDPARGIYAGDFLKILRTAEAPAVLLEVGVIANPAEEQDLSDPATIARLADAVAEAVSPPPRRFRTRSAATASG